MVLCDSEIQERVGIEPFEGMAKRPGRISFGVSSYGYDVRVGTRFKVFTNATSGGTAVVSLLGVGAATAPREEAFHQAAERAVDLLFVVDSSGSMGDEQSALVAGFQTLVDQAAKWSVEFFETSLPLL